MEEFTGQGDNQDTSGNQGDNQDNKGSQEGTGSGVVFTDSTGRQYTQEDLNTKILSSDAHIAKIEAENKEKDGQIIAALEKAEELQAKGDSTQRLADLLSNDRKQDQTENQGAVVKDQQPAVSKQEIADIVRSSIAEEKTAQVKSQNMSTCMAKAKESFGDNFQEEVAKKAADLGMAIEELNTLAGNNPKVFETLVLPTKPMKSSNFTGAGSESIAKNEGNQINYKAASFKQRSAYLKEMGVL